jgi:hypothetical protein
MVDTTTHDVMVEQTRKTQEVLDYFQGFRGSADQIIEQIRASLTVKFYINEPLGNDTAEGGENTPVKTLEEAISRVPAGAFGTIIFKTSVSITEKINTRARGLLFEAYPTVSPALRSDWRVGDDGLLYPGQINFAGSYGSVGFHGVGMHFEERPAGTRADAYASGVFTTNSLTPPLFAGLFNCAITRDAGADAYLIAASADAATLNVSTDVTYSSAMDGYWFAGVASGTNRSATRYNTNIVSL